MDVNDVIRHLRVENSRLFSVAERAIRLCEGVEWGTEQERAELEFILSDWQKVFDR